MQNAMKPDAESGQPPKKTATEEDDDSGTIDKVIGFFDNADRQQSGLSLLGKVFGASNTKLQLEFDPRFLIVYLCMYIIFSYTVLNII